MTEPLRRGTIEHSGLDEAIRERDALMGLSYRLLGSVADAEDAVQETYIRWYRLGEAERRRVVTPRAWLIRAAGRICLDMLSTARARRERYVGEWLPEPVPDSATWTSLHGRRPPDPADRVSFEQSVSMALMIVLASLTPAERVVFVLHDVFGHTFPEVGEVVGRSPQACRQLATSARRRIREETPRRARVPAAEHAAVVRSFKTAWETGDVSALVGLLDADATAITDGGGIVSAALDPLLGADAVAGLLIGVHERQPDIAIRDELVNGELGLVVVGGGTTLAVISLRHERGRVTRVWAVRNPEKLQGWPAGGSVRGSVLSRPGRPLGRPSGRRPAVGRRLPPP